MDRTAIGTKQGGVFSKLVDEVHLIGIPSKIPEAFEVDVTELPAHGQWKFSDLKAPGGQGFVRLTLSMPNILVFSSSQLLGIEVETKRRRSRVILLQ